VEAAMGISVEGKKMGRKKEDDLFEALGEATDLQ